MQHYKDRIISSKKFDFNLLYVYHTLLNFDYYTLPVDIKEQIDNLKEKVANLVFDPMPKDCDIVEEEYYMVNTYEKTNFNKKN